MGPMDSMESYYLKNNVCTTEYGAIHKPCGHRRGGRWFSKKITKVYIPRKFAFIQKVKNERFAEIFGKKLRWGEWVFEKTTWQVKKPCQSVRGMGIKYVHILFLPLQKRNT